MTSLCGCSRAPGLPGSDRVCGTSKTDRVRYFANYRRSQIRKIGSLILGNVGNLGSLERFQTCSPHFTPGSDLDSHGAFFITFLFAGVASIAAGSDAPVCLVVGGPIRTITVFVWVFVRCLILSCVQWASGHFSWLWSKV